MFTLLTITAAVLLVLVFLSIIESAYESLSEVSLRVMVADHEGRPGVSFLREILEHRTRFELVLILGTQLSIAAIAILLAQLMSRAGIESPIAITFVVVFAVILLFRQLLPRVLAQNNPERVFWSLLPLFRPVYKVLNVFVTPIHFVLEKLKSPEAEEEGTGEEDEEMTEEIQAFIDVAEEEGIIEESEGELIQSIIEFGNTRVGEIMRPRPQIVAIEATSSMADVLRLIVEAKYSRIPVYRDGIDNIEGVVYVRDLLGFLVEGKDNRPVTECLRPAYFVPESKSIADLLREMQKAKVQLAMVIDEYGGVAGLVTIEDMIEEILGEIEDEDRVISDQEAIVKSEDGSYLVDGRAEIRKIELLYGAEVEADDFTTVAGLLINKLGHVPYVGESLDFKGIQFEVVDADSKRVNRVRLRSTQNVASAGRPGSAIDPKASS